ncbi:protein-tyrosine-phosphatase IBR5-like [Durio zibethinus]|uniref:Protein-tyrosine-phosphatase IBR5-like n=1 Tax=Durio zibethinus TaxID=66656 RepID=A0A6P5XID1_DURZI|nr:protein-tyrosine-phosphatase IBR5-like [Durio zibethinus]
MTYSYGIYIISLQTVPACQNLYKNSFTYHCLQDDKILQFDDAVQFLEQCERDKAQVLVHCMSGKNRSPAIVIAYLMKSKGWRLPQSYQWVKEQRSSVKSRNMSERSLDHLIAAILLCLPSHLRSPHPSTLASQSQMIQFLFLFLFLLSTILVLLLFLPVHL